MELIYTFLFGKTAVAKPSDRAAAAAMAKSFFMTALPFYCRHAAYWFVAASCGLLLCIAFGWGKPDAPAASL